MNVGDDGRALLYCHTGCTFDAIVGALGLAESDLFAEGDATTPIPVSVVRYEIRTTEGILKAIHERRATPDGKRYLWYQPDGTPRLGVKVAELPLYGSERIGQWGPALPIVLTEGEKAADALLGVDIPALATVTGAAGTPGPDSLTVLQDREVILWPDNDEPGVEHMRRVAEVLAKIAKRVRLVHWEDAPAKADAADCVGLYDINKVRSLLEHAAVAQTAARTFSTDLEIHTAVFRAQNIRIEFDLTRTDSRGETSSEITIYNGSPDPLHKSRLNLLSTRSKSELANALGRRVAPADIPWDEMIEWSSLQALSAHRRGSQPIALADAPDAPEGGELLGNLVSPTGVTIFFGDGGSGKSQLLQAIAASLHEGINLLGFEPAQKMNVLYLDWEDEDWVHRHRIKRLIGRESSMLYLRMAHSLSHSIDQLRPIVRDYDIGLIAVDSVAPASGGDVNEQMIADEFFSAPRRLQVPMICAAHNTKAQDDQKPFGSAFFHNLSRRTWYVKNTQEPGSAEMMLGVFSRKNNLGPRFHDIGYKVVFEPDRTNLTSTNVRDVPQLNERASIRERIIGLLAESGAMKVIDIASELGYEGPSGIQTIRNALNAGKDRVFVNIYGVDRVWRWGVRSDADDPQ